jgi:manganese efflux pump family protein
MGIAALIAWLVTALGGFYLLGKWIANGGLKQPRTSSFPPALIFGHFALAAIGLVVWIVYLLIDQDVLSWVAFGLLVPVALLGFTMLARWLGGRRAGAGAGASTDAGAAEQRFPVPAVAGHGLVAVTTVVLVLLTAVTQ